MPCRECTFLSCRLTYWCDGVLTRSVFRSGQVVDAGSPDKVNPIQMLLMFEAGGMTIADIPPPVWFLITKVVLPFARFLGYQAFHPEYY